jgi:hypothetical protein
VAWTLQALSNQGDCGMLREGHLYRIDAWVIALFVAMVATAWAGYRLALWRERKKESPTEIGPIEPRSPDSSRSSSPSRSG